MIYFSLVAAGLLLHVFYWGVGGSLLTMPRPWRACWPVFIAPVGYSLQSLVVWAGAYANLPGTDSYAWRSELVPLVLLAVAIRFRGGPRMASDLKAFRWVGLAMAACLGLSGLALAIGAGGAGLTTLSLGSCDAADYAAGARVLKEFAHSDRSGFLGLTEVVRVMSADNFFDFWLRLNHFTPSALIALNGSILHCAPDELTGIFTATVLASSLPGVYWLARAVLRYRAKTSLWIALLYGFSPITWYALAEVAIAQLLAAQAIAMLTWAGIALWRVRFRAGRGGALTGVMGIAFLLILGSYNFILAIALIPAAAAVGGFALWGQEWRRLFGWIGWMALALVVAGTVYAERVAGLAERFILFQTYDFGWKIAPLTPEGWLGMVQGPGLEAYPIIWRSSLSSVVVLLLGASFLRGAKQRAPEVFLALGLAVPPLIGYAYLTWRGQHLGTNASYDAYKVISVFYPGLLAALCYWVKLIASRSMVARSAAWGMIGIVTAGVAAAACQFSNRLAQPGLGVNRSLRDLKRLEGTPDVNSVNLRMPDMWARLWANTFLLKIPQYFPVHSYEGRLNTPLRGDWDLNGDLIHLELPAGGSRRINPEFSLADTRSPFFLRVQTGEGWYDLERPPSSVQAWRWTKEHATLQIENPQNYRVRMTARFSDVRSESQRDFQLWCDGRQLCGATITPAGMSVTAPEIVLPPGLTVLEIRSGSPLTGPAAGETRSLGFRIFSIDLKVRPDN